MQALQQLHSQNLSHGDIKPENFVVTSTGWVYLTYPQRFARWLPSFHESKLLTEAAKLQLKAAKTDILFKMLDSFNKNSIQVTTRWTLLDNMLGILGFFLSPQSANPPATHSPPSSPSSRSSPPCFLPSRTTPTSRNPPKPARSVPLFPLFECSHPLYGHWSR